MYAFISGYNSIEIIEVDRDSQQYTPSCTTANV